MWRGKRRDRYGKGVHDFKDHDRGSIHDEDPRRDDRVDRERSTDRFIDDYDSFNTNYDVDRAYNEPETDLGYQDDRGEREDRYYDRGAEDVRYREDRRRGDEVNRYRDDPDRQRAELLDSREVRNTRDGEYDIPVSSNYFDADRPFYRDDRVEYRDDRGDLINDGREWDDDRIKHAGGRDDYRNEEPTYRHEGAEFIDENRENYRDQDRETYRQNENSGFRTDRDRERHVSNIDGDMFDRREDTRNRFAEPDKAEFRNNPSRLARGKNIRNVSTRGGANRSRAGRNFHRGRPGFRPADRVHNPKGKTVLQRAGRQEHSWKKDVGRKEQASSRRTDLKLSTADQQTKDTFVSPISRQEDHKFGSLNRSKKVSEEKKKPEKSVKDFKGSNSRIGQSAQTKSVSNKSDTALSQSRRSSDSKTRHSSSSTVSKGKQESKKEVKKEVKHSHVESEKSRDREIQDNKRGRHGSGHHTDMKSEARKIYGSFHEEDAISILADDDGFTHETRNYFGTDKVSSGKLKSEPDAKEKSNKVTSNENKHGDKRSSGNTGRQFDKIRDPRHGNSKDSHRETAYLHNKEVTYNNGKASVPFGKPFRKFGPNKFGNRNEKFAFGNRNFSLNSSSVNTKSRQQDSNQGNDQASVRYGRTGAILKDDRFQEEKDNSSEGNRNNVREAKEKSGRGRFKWEGRGIHRSNQVKRKYLGKGFSRRGNFGQNKNDRDRGNFFDDDRSEHFSKFRNERDENDFSKGISLDEEMLSPDNFGPSDPNQQIIYFQNPDFQDGQVLDQYGNAVVNPDLLSGSFQQHMPVQFFPSNLGADAPPGTEYVFIPFVNNDPAMGSGNMPDTAVSVENDNMQGIEEERRTLESNTGSKAKQMTNQWNSSRKKVKPLSLAQRNNLRKKLIAEKRRKMERRVEQRILQKLMQKTQDLKKENSAETKTKPIIKRLSPPAASTSARTPTGQVRGHKQRRQDLDDVSADEYENVSDLEDITDDENGGRNEDYPQTGERRQAFRKPGEPRLATKTKATAGNVQVRGKKEETWQFSDVRKVVEKKSDSLKRGKDSHSDEKTTFIKKQKTSSGSQRNRPRTPIEITVNNDKFVYNDDDDNNDQDNDVHEHRRGRRSESREIYEGGRRRSRDRDRPQGKYERKNRNSRDRYDDREDSPHRGSARQTDRKQRDGKYYEDDEYKNRPRKSRFSDAEENRSYRSSESREENRQGQVSNMGRSSGQDMRDTMGTNLMPSNFLNSQNQSQQNFSTPFAQQQMSQAGNQFNSPQSLPFGFQQANFNQTGFPMGNSDPSLPPVSQGSMNMSPFGQPNLAVHPDMSLPPTVGPIAGTASSMVLTQHNFPQQNLQSSMPMQHTLFPSGMQQNQSFGQQQQQQQVQQMNRPLQGVGPVQANTAVNQQNISSSMHGSRPGFQHSNSPLYQQSHLQVGNVQQQALMGSMVGSSNQTQGSISNPLQNQQSGQVLFNNSFVTGQQGFVASQSNSKNSYMPASANEAMKSVKNVGPGASESNPNVRPKNPQMRRDKPQIFAGRRGTGMLAVPRGSLQAAGVAVRQKTQGSHRGGGRTGVVAKGANQLFISQPGTSGFAADDIDEEIGEMLCIKCDKVFLSESVMRRHSKWHILAEAGVKELRCDICQQGFTSSVAFNVHMREHHSATTLKCDKCNLTFTNSAALARHNRTGFHQGK